MKVGAACGGAAEAPAGMPHRGASAAVLEDALEADEIEHVQVAAPIAIGLGLARYERGLEIDEVENVDISVPIEIGGAAGLAGDDDRDARGRAVQVGRRAGEHEVRRAVLVDVSHADGVIAELPAGVHPGHRAQHGAVCPGDQVALASVERAAITDPRGDEDVVVPVAVGVARHAADAESLARLLADLVPDELARCATEGRSHVPWSRQAPSRRSPG